MDVTKPWMKKYFSSIERLFKSCMRNLFVGICVHLTNQKVYVPVILEVLSLVMKMVKLLFMELLLKCYHQVFSEIRNATHAFIQFKIFSLELFDFEKCGKIPSFFVDVYLHIVFIQCILDGLFESHCQRQQYYRDRENDRSIGSRLYFSSWMLLTNVISKLY